MEPLDYRGIERLRKKCFSFSRTLLSYKRDFNFTLRVGSFEMSIGTGGPCGRKAGQGGRRRNPSYIRRQQRRRQAFLKKRGLAGDNSGSGGAEAGADRDDKEVDGGVNEEGDGRELTREQEESVTIWCENIARMLKDQKDEQALQYRERLDGMEELRKEMRSINDSSISEFSKSMKEIIASDPGERDEEVEESDGDDHDHLVEFAGRLGSGMRCFQRQVQATDRKVQETRWKTTTSPKSPRKKRRRKK